MNALHDADGLALQEIGDPNVTRDNVALTYAFMIWQETPKLERYDWKAVNEAIIERWSVSALEYIKKKAWDLVEKKKRRLRAEPNTKEGDVT